MPRHVNLSFSSGSLCCSVPNLSFSLVFIAIDNVFFSGACFGVMFCETDVKFPFADIAGRVRHTGLTANC